jgi:hypothetical protein
MKKIILLLAIAFTTTTFSQEITLQKGRYYVNDKQISTRDTKSMLASNPEALKLFKKGKNRESFGGLLIGLGGAMIAVDGIKGLVSDLSFPGPATYIGAGALVLSIPILIGKNKKMTEGIEMYNKGLKNTGFNNDLELHVISNQNGYGLQLRF